MKSLIPKSGILQARKRFAYTKTNTVDNGYQVKTKYLIKYTNYLQICNHLLNRNVQLKFF